MGIQSLGAVRSGPWQPINLDSILPLFYRSTYFCRLGSKICTYFHAVLIKVLEVQLLFLSASLLPPVALKSLVNAPASSLHHALKPDQKGNVNLTFMPSPYLWNCLSIISEWLIQKTLSISKPCCHTDFSEPLILNHINNIRFPNLRKICLSKNDIDSIEGINLLWMPNLHELKLSENKISFIKSLRKCLLPSLRYMQLGIIKK